MKTMFDAAYLPSPVPAGFDVAAGYVWQAHHEAAHIWTAGDWDRAEQACRFLLPIATCWTPFGNGQADAVQAIQAWKALGFQGPCAFALDMEYDVALQPGAKDYATAWRAGVRSLGYYDIVYSSASARAFLGDGPKWLGPPAGLGGDVVIVQEHYEATIDTNQANDAVPFYDTQPVVVTPTGGNDMPADKDTVDVYVGPDGAWALQYDGGVDTLRGPFYGSYFSLPATTRNDPARRFLTICAPVDGLPHGYSVVSLNQEPYTFHTVQGSTTA